MTSGESHCARSATRWPRTPAGSGPIATSIAALRKQTWLGRFISTYGWRAYALPVLIALTGVVVYQTITGTSAPAPKEAEGPVQGPPTIGVASTRSSVRRPRGSRSST